MQFHYPRTQIGKWQDYERKVVEFIGCALGTPDQAGIGDSD